MKRVWISFIYPKVLCSWEGTHPSCSFLKLIEICTLDSSRFHNLGIVRGMVYKKVSSIIYRHKPYHPSIQYFPHSYNLEFFVFEIRLNSCTSSMYDIWILKVKGLWKNFYCFTAQILICWYYRYIIG